jgi:hypothetical protein
VVCVFRTSITVRRSKSTTIVPKISLGTRFDARVKSTNYALSDRYPERHPGRVTCPPKAGAALAAYSRYSADLEALA